MKGIGHVPLPCISLSLHTHPPTHLFPNLPLLFTTVTSTPVLISFPLERSP